MTPGWPGLSQDCNLHATQKPPAGDHPHHAMLLDATASQAPLAPAPAGVTPVFPPDLTLWVGKEALLRSVRAAASRAGGDSWLDLVRTGAPDRTPNGLTVVMAYCYLQSTYHSFDILRRLEQDPVLAEFAATLELTPEKVRRFRREHRRSLTDCLTHALVALWKERHPHLRAGPLSAGLLASRMEFSFLEPFYLHAQDRIDRAVVLDSMSLDE